jgi:LysR family transcriptional regulator, nitrogen assimilation regulatory protein
MEFLDLQYFVSIADTGSFTKSALQNNVAQSALSRRVRDLETELGTALFYRNGRGVVLTEAGETFLTRARGILAEVEALRQDMRQSAGALDGTVKLAVPPSVGLILLAPLLSQIRIDYPQIRMKVLEGFSGHVADWLSAGKVDLAVLYKTKSSALLDAEHLLFEDLYLISGAQAPVLGDGGAVSLAQIAPEELVLPGLPHGLRVLVDSASAQAQVPLNIAMELETLPTICDLAATGTIRTILPLTAVQAGLKAGTLVAQKIDSPPISRELILAHAPHRAAAPATKAVVRLIRSHIAELVRSGLWVGRI